MKTVDASACRVVMEPHRGERFNYSIYPCGHWFRPAAGKYDIWLESPTYVSSAVAVATYVDAPFQGRGSPALMPVVAAGNVVLKRTVDRSEARSLRIVSLRAIDGSLYERQVPVEQAYDGILVPTGPAVIGLFASDGSILGISSPLDVSEGEVVTVDSLTSSDTVVAILDNPEHREGVEFALSRQGSSRAPGSVVVSREKVVAVWYGVEHGPFRIAATMKHDQVVVGTGAVRPATVTTIRGTLSVANSQPATR